MFSLTVSELVKLPATSDIRDVLPEGARAYLVTEGGEIKRGLAELPCTQLTPLMSEGDAHTYKLEVRGYSVGMFVAIVTACATRDFAEADRLINSIPSQMRR